MLCHFIACHLGDLWGPLLICLALSVLMSLTSPDGQASLVFTAVFMIEWLGAAIVTLNAQLLGAKISFFQSVCIIGYCLFPLTMAAFVLFFLPQEFEFFLVKLAIVVVGYLWSIRASVVFISGVVEEKRRALAVFPVFLFYVVVGWYVVCCWDD